MLKPSESLREDTEPVDQATTHPSASGSFTGGQLIGRYLVIARLGAGAMGVVLAAYDPKLDRKVALKLLRARGAEVERAQERLRREAQALAKLGHRNVVGVYDVDMHGEQLFVSMEFVEGQTLGEWMAGGEGVRPWREVLERFMAAGRGLAAAHQAGLVHRDFKPDNVMVGDDGQVRVMDFGLSRVGAGEDEGEDETSTEVDAEAPVGRLTRTGTMVGTPAYMSVEQFMGGEVDGRSDQFGFCVALYEGLYGERPFAGETVGQLLKSLGEGRVNEAPTGSKVPAWLRRVVLRGLAKEPDKRWPSMEALLEALADDPAPRRRRRIAVGLALTLVAGSAWGVTEALRADREYCKHTAEKLVGVWDDDRRAEVKEAISSTQVSYAPDTWERVESHLDEYAQVWLAARTEACEATRHGEQSEQLLDLRMGCLDERKRQLRATVDELAQADAQVVEEAVTAVLGLPGLERCADLDALTADVPPPEDPEVAARVAELDEKLAEVKAKAKFGKYAEGLKLADAVVAEGETLDYEPLMVRAWLQQANLQGENSEYDKAEATLKRALYAALAQTMKGEAASASIQLVYIVGTRQGRLEDGRRWAELATPLVRADNTDEARAAGLHNLGAMARFEGKYEDASDYYERAKAIYEKALGSDHPRVALLSLNSLGLVAYKMGKYEDARNYFERALAIYEKALGPDHPKVSYFLSNLGTLAEAEGKYEDARNYYERALAIEEKALGPDNASVALSLDNLGDLAKTEGKYEDARDYYGRALAIREKTLGPDHVLLAHSFSSLGILADEEGSYEEARKYQERALAILEKALGSNHSDVAKLLVNLGLVARHQGKYEDARDCYERGLAIQEQALGSDHLDVGHTLNLLGTLAQSEGKYEDAREYQERALAIQEKALGPDHLAVSVSLSNLGVVAYYEGNYEDARDYLERKLAIQEKALGPDHPGMVLTLTNLGELAKTEGKYEDARNYHERALAIQQQALGPNHPRLAHVLINLASVAEAEGKHEEARGYCERGLAIQEQALGPNHPSLAWGLTELGIALLGLDQASEALTHLERALTIGITHEGDPTELAATRFALARALWIAPAASSRDRPRARELAKLARATYAEDGDTSAEELEEVQIWLAQHP